jgi:hypothetical protein
VPVESADLISGAFVTDLLPPCPESPSRRPVDLDAKALQGARSLDLPTAPAALLRLTDGTEPAVLAAALVRVALDKKSPRAVREAADG